MLLAAIARMAGKGRHVELTIVGDGPERQSLEQAISEQRLAGVVRLAVRATTTA